MVDVSKHPLLEDAHAVCTLIEALPASEEQTDAIQRANELMQALEEIVDRGEASTFLGDMLAELARAEAEHGSYNSYHEAYAVILEELDEFWEIVRQKTGMRDGGAARRELIQIAVTAWRSARDLGLDD